MKKKKNIVEEPINNVELCDEVTIEMDIHVTKVVKLPAGVKASEQLTYDQFNEGKGKVPARKLYSLFNSLAPIVSEYDDFGIRNYQLFITREETNDGSGKESESKGNVQESELAGQS